MKGLRKVAKGIALSLTVALTAGSVPAIEARAAGDGKALTQKDFLKADGKNLRNNSGTGDIINLRGTNAGGYLFQEFWMTPTAATDNVRDEKTIYEKLTERFGEEAMMELVDTYQDAYWTEKDFDRCAELGMNTIRLPFWWRNLVDEKGEFYENAFDRMDWFVKEAGERGIYVVLDFHGAPGSQNGSDHSGVDGLDDKEEASEFFFGSNAAENQKKYYDIWEKIAEHYKDNPVVAGYDLLNEPFCTYRYSAKLDADGLHDLLWNVYDKAYDTIREVDPNHVIIMEAVWDPGDLPDPDNYDWKNVMYEYHNYLYDDYDNEKGGQISNMQTKLNSIANMDYNVPSYMGEFSYFNQPSAWDEGLALLNDSGINWTTWTYKTVEEFGMWGLYHHLEEFNKNKIDLETASFEEIKDFWSRMGEVEQNKDLTDVVSKYYAAGAVENQLSPVLVDVEAGIYYLVGNNTSRIVTTNTEALGLIAATDLKQDDSNKQKFEFVKNDDKTISLKSLENNKYVSLGEDKVLYATADSIGDKEKFYLMKASDTTVALRSFASGKFACVDENYDGTEEYKGKGIPVIVRSDSASGWETFRIYGEDEMPAGDTNEYDYSGWIYFEAEDEGKVTRVGGKTTDDNKDNFSNGWAVADLGTDKKAEEVADDWSNIHYIKFDVNAETEGTYKMVIRYNGDDDKSILVKTTEKKNQSEKVDRGDVTTVFSDVVAGKWYVDAVQYVYNNGIMGGKGTKFDPGANILREEFVQTIYNHSGKPTINAETTTFPDVVTGKWYVDAVIWAKANDITAGKGDGNFGVNENISRQDLAVMLYKYAALKDYDLTKEDGLIDNFRDTQKVSYAKDALNWALTQGIMSGKGEGKLDPIGNATRAECAVMLMQLIKKNQEPEAADVQVVSIPRVSPDANWSTMHEKYVTINLKEGTNTVYISGVLENKGWINLDRIDISNQPIIEREEDGKTYERYEAENFATTGSLESQDFFSNGITVGAMNTGVAFENIAEEWTNIKYVDFTVYAGQAGKYQVILNYNGDGSDGMKVVYRVNKGDNHALTLNNAGNEWNVMNKKSFSVELQEGFNDLMISGTIAKQSNWANIDCIDIRRMDADEVDEEEPEEPEEPEQPEELPVAVSGWSRYEAEEAEAHAASEGNAVVEEQSFFSKGKAIGNLSNGGVALEDVAEDLSNLNYVLFTVKAKKDGNYRLVVGYNGDDDKTAVYKVNDNPQESISVPAVEEGHNWDIMHEIVLTVPLKAGDNTVAISGAVGPGWMNVDYIDVSNAPINITDDEKGTERFEAEDFQNTGSTEGCDQYSNGSAIGRSNSDAKFDEIAEDWSNVKYVDFTVYVSEAGSYRIDMGYDGENRENMPVVYRVNGGENQKISLNAIGWSNVLTTNFTVDLKKGFNNLKISGTIEDFNNWINLDYIDVTRVD